MENSPEFSIVRFAFQTLGWHWDTGCWEVLFSNFDFYLLFPSLISVSFFPLLLYFSAYLSIVSYADTSPFPSHLAKEQVQ